MKPLGLVAFDLDGTLVRIWSAWSWIHNLLGTTELAKPNAERYYAGEINYHQWAELDVQLWHGVPIDRIEKAIQNGLVLIPGTDNLIHTLQNWRLKTAIISSGLSIFAKRVQEILNIDMSRANRLITDAKGLIIGVDVQVAYDNKHQVLIDIAKIMDIPLSRCVAIGDAPNDIPMFRVAGASIAFNPSHDDVAANATSVVHSENALDILPPLRQFYQIKSR